MHPTKLDVWLLDTLICEYLDLGECVLSRDFQCGRAPKTEARNGYSASVGR